ncbi:MAG: hypothetical protein AAGE52_33570 [Myxococcota bacterium]
MSCWVRTLSVSLVVMLVGVAPVDAQVVRSLAEVENASEIEALIRLELSDVLRRDEVRSDVASALGGVFVHVRDQAFLVVDESCPGCQHLGFLLVNFSEAPAWGLDVRVTFELNHEVIEESVQVPVAPARSATRVRFRIPFQMSRQVRVRRGDRAPTPGTVATRHDVLVRGRRLSPSFVRELRDATLRVTRRGLTNEPGSMGNTNALEYALEHVGPEQGQALAEAMVSAGATSALRNYVAEHAAHVAAAGFVAALPETDVRRFVERSESISPELLLAVPLRTATWLAEEIVRRGHPLEPILVAVSRTTELERFRMLTRALPETARLEALRHGWEALTPDELFPARLRYLRGLVQDDSDRALVGRLVSAKIRGGSSVVSGLSLDELRPVVADRFGPHDFVFEFASLRLLPELIATYRESHDNDDAVWYAAMRTVERARFRILAHAAGRDPEERERMARIGWLRLRPDALLAVHVELLRTLTPDPAVAGSAMASRLGGGLEIVPLIELLNEEELAVFVGQASGNVQGFGTLLNAVPDSTFEGLVVAIEEGGPEAQAPLWYAAMSATNEARLTRMIRVVPARREEALRIGWDALQPGAWVPAQLDFLRSLEQSESETRVAAERVFHRALEGHLPDQAAPELERLRAASPEVLREVYSEELRRFPVFRTEALVAGDVDLYAYYHDTLPNFAGCVGVLTVEGATACADAVTENPAFESLALAGGLSEFLVAEVEQLLLMEGDPTERAALAERYEPWGVDTTVVAAGLCRESDDALNLFRPKYLAAVESLDPHASCLATSPTVVILWVLLGAGVVALLALVFVMRRWRRRRLERIMALVPEG